MTSETVETLIVGGGQAGLAIASTSASAGCRTSLSNGIASPSAGVREHWDSLVANGPAWHDRFPGMRFADVDPDGFAHRDQVVAYFEAYARQIGAPVRCGSRSPPCASGRTVPGFRSTLRTG